MWCKTCAYYKEAPDAATCRDCGRYLSNKQGQLAAAFVLAVSLALFSHYLLTGYLIGGPDGARLVWVQSALTAPYSIYESSAYMAAVALTLSALAVIPAMMVLHFGLAPGLLTAFAAGLLSGVYFAPVSMPLAAAVAAAPWAKALPRLFWLILSVIAGILSYFFLARQYGPSGASLYGGAMYDFLTSVGMLSLIIATIAGLVAAISRYNSLAAVGVVALLAFAPAIVFFKGVTPGKLEASLLRYVYDPARMLNGSFPEGFASGETTSRDRSLAPKRQLGNVLDTFRYVDNRRSKAIEACDRYLRHRFASDDAPQVMLLKTEMLNVRVDLAVLGRLNRLETYSDRVAAESRPIYTSIVNHFPSTPEAALAGYYLAEGAFQAGKIADAQTLFGAAGKALDAFIPPSFHPGAQPPATTAAELYRSRGKEQRELEARLYAALMETRRRQALISHNSDFGGAPLARFAALDPRDEAFAADAANLIAAYQSSQLVDNVRLTLAERLADPVDRRTTLETLLDQSPDSDVRDRMLYVTARAELAADLSGDAARLAELHLRRLLADYPSSTYYADATELLAKVTAASKAAEAEATRP